MAEPAPFSVEGVQLVCGWLAGYFRTGGTVPKALTAALKHEQGTEGTTMSMLAVVTLLLEEGAGLRRVTVRRLADNMAEGALASPALGRTPAGLNVAGVLDLAARMTETGRMSGRQVTDLVGVDPPTVLGTFFDAAVAMTRMVAEHRKETPEETLQWLALEVERTGLG